MVDYFFTLLWILATGSVAIYLTSDFGLAQFVTITKSHPVFMGFSKFFILATLGELLGRRFAFKKWQFTKISLLHRAFIWGLFGISFTYVFPIFSAGVDELIRSNLLFIPTSELSAKIMTSFWKSFFINMIFAFPFMTLHRITDTLIDRGILFSKWPFIKIWKELDWDTQWNKVAPTIVWFWIPAHTITFALPPEYRILLAAYLGIILGIILTFLKGTKRV